MGTTYCLSVALCCRVLHCSQAVKQAWAGPCTVLTFTTTTFSALFFWVFLQPTAVHHGDDLVVYGAVGDLIGVALGCLLGHLISGDRRLAEWRGRRAPVPPPREPPPHTLPRIAQQEAIEIQSAAVPMAVAVPVYNVVKGEPVAMATEPMAAAGGQPPLVTIAEILRRELELPASEIANTVDAACAQLGVPAHGALMGRAQRCWQALGCPEAEPRARLET